jgi:hypothetical protein
MKEVKDMNLAEAITALRDVDVITRGWQCNYDAIEELANRIDTLLFEQAQRHDAWVDALENRINSLEAKHRWISVLERLPTEADADGNGYVEFWNTKYQMSNYYKYDFLPERYGLEITHWRTITPPEGV